MAASAAATGTLPGRADTVGPDASPAGAWPEASSAADAERCSAGGVAVPADASDAAVSARSPARLR